MKVLKVESVVPNLIASCHCEFALKCLELQNDDDRAGDHKHIDPLSHSRNGILEVNPTFVLRKHHPHNLDFFYPCSSLCLLQI